MVVSKKFVFFSVLLCAISTSIVAVKSNENKKHADRQLPLPGSPELEASLHKMKEKPKKKSRWQQMCRTFKGARRSPNFLRELAYEALKRIGCASPEKVIVFSDIKKQPYCYSQMHHNKLTSFINFPYKDDMTMMIYGTFRCIMFHEAAHLKYPHSNDIDYLKHQDVERYADKIGVMFAYCKNCAKEYAKFFLDMHNFSNKNNQYTFDQLESFSTEQLKIWLGQLIEFSKKINSTHPQDLERAVNILIYSRQIPALCDYHKDYPVHHDMTKFHRFNNASMLSCCARKLSV